MAGKKQHYIPKFILRGFSSRSKGDEFYTYVYRRNVSPYESNITGVASERYFYGNPSLSSADDRITESENRYSQIVHRYRELNGMNWVGSEDSIALVAHMRSRVKHIRESLVDSGKLFLDLFLSQLGCAGKSEDLIKGFIRANRKEVAKNIKERLPDSFSDELKIVITKKILDNPEKWARGKEDELQQHFLGPIAELATGFHHTVKESHIKLFERGEDYEAVMQNLSRFRWKIDEAGGYEVVFGDVGPVAISCADGRQVVKSLMLVNDKIDFIILPLSSRHLLIGQSKKEEPCWNIDELNMSIVRLSNELFVSRCCREYEKRLWPMIGQDSSVFNSNDITYFKSKIRREFIGKK